MATAETDGALRGRRGVRALLFSVLALACPVPLLLVGPGQVPAARLLELAVATGAVMLLENGGGVAGALLSVFLVQAAFWLGIFWVLAGAAARALGPLGPRAAPAAALALAVLALVIAASADVYRTPFGRQARASLWDVYR